MNKVLILFAHPRFEKSKTNRALLAGVDKIEGVTLNDLYEEYPDFNINVSREKEMLVSSSVIVWHFPLYTYGMPALLKQWMDVVLDYGWAHGGKGNFLQGKIVFAALTAAGTRESYAAHQYNQYTLRDFLVPLAQTASLCKMIYLPPFAVHGTNRLTDHELASHSRLYHQMLACMVKGEFSIESICQYDYLNDWLLSEEGRA